ncbi:hypothetical protein BL250_10775 [Erwinia sp. OLTSP20]|uniref:hypothetical protein n=1 Tax=unclassified Erwinia TaxID=2622719 RepID=UPI000C197160|nr:MULTISPECIES: hypothetical protein [unclassified Erwinia]PIJ50162.1 hypothetical protein BV501_10005 [Erwinia sp. OAMSP11]PIJ71928.1 hypothetical protein BK416_11085 [Erwinia sp. OLSSP12]PIJ81130.1 hypothetical protein BLD47_09945 [Erwinia sp. OLCASP19]PIJ83560.1 hypothetical protein BLD46_09735 [Erwinia sp. OLMTSP26]PIJ86175.1 hypothetical protein BLD49_09060 [Erwinia sp. OLMDSP33]
MFCIDYFFSCYVGSLVVNRSSKAYAFDHSYYHKPKAPKGYPALANKRKLSVTFKAFLKKMAEKRQQLVIAEVDALIP